ncbi:hypothetical protein FN846DRAFT_992271 [Sphaerosporella brunnea]|uniref:Uncharacterized protein n=1 Tax=Sphaerosporella brunnea TaxID=1250544 RepID=A0A5J5ENS1_9PEZI|nr:hypothetical protein FN846DRAFT_992271 [Sphaerosporella brunnea]
MNRRPKLNANGQASFRSKAIHPRVSRRLQIQAQPELLTILPSQHTHTHTNPNPAHPTSSYINIQASFTMPRKKPAPTADGDIADAPKKEKKPRARKPPTKKPDAKDPSTKKPRAPRKKKCDKLAERDNNAGEPSCNVEGNPEDEAPGDGNDGKAKKSINRVKSGRITKSAKDNSTKKPRAPRKKKSDKLAERDENAGEPSCKFEENSDDDDESLLSGDDKKGKKPMNRVRSGRIAKSAKDNSTKKPRAPRKKKSDKLAERDENAGEPSCKFEENSDDESLLSGDDRKGKKPMNRRIAKSTPMIRESKFAPRVAKLSTSISALAVTGASSLIHIGRATLFKLVDDIPDDEEDCDPWLLTDKELDARIALIEEALRLHDQVEIEGFKPVKKDDGLSEYEDDDEQEFMVGMVEDEEEISEEE